MTATPVQTEEDERETSRATCGRSPRVSSTQSAPTSSGTEHQAVFAQETQAQWCMINYFMMRSANYQGNWIPAMSPGHHLTTS